MSRTVNAIPDTSLAPQYADNLFAQAAKRLLDAVLQKDHRADRDSFERRHPLKIFLLAMYNGDEFPVRLGELHGVPLDEVKDFLLLLDLHCTDKTEPHVFFVHGPRIFSTMSLAEQASVRKANTLALEQAQGTIVDLRRLVVSLRDEVAQLKCVSEAPGVEAGCAD